MAPRKPIPRIYEEHAGWFALARQQGKFSEREYLETFARRLPPGGTVLDLGCGNGRPMAEVLIGWGFRAPRERGSHGLDRRISEESVIITLV